MRETGTGQQVARLHDRYMMMMIYSFAITISVSIIAVIAPSFCFLFIGINVWKFFIYMHFALRELYYLTLLCGGRF